MVDCLQEYMDKYMVNEDEMKGKLEECFFSYFHNEEGFASERD